MADQEATLRQLLAALVGDDDDVVQYLVEGISADPDEVAEILQPFVDESDSPDAHAICTRIVDLATPSESPGARAAAGAAAGAGAGAALEQRTREPEPEPEAHLEPELEPELETEPLSPQQDTAATARTTRLEAMRGTAAEAEKHDEGDGSHRRLAAAVRIGDSHTSIIIPASGVDQRQVGEMVAGRVRCTHCGVEVDIGAFRCQRCGNAAPRAAAAPSAAPKASGAIDGKLAQRRAAKAAAKAAAGVAKAERATDEGGGAFELTGLSEKRFLAIFGKELQKRQAGGGKKAKHQGKEVKIEIDRFAGGHRVTRKSLSCDHRWSGSGAAGVRCQVCNFETQQNSYHCSKRPACGIALCGSCNWKWKAATT
jgi:hypothetical protein